MPVAHILKKSEIIRSARTAQLEGLFELPPTERSEVSWTASLPFEERSWNIGLIVGPSGCGKSTIARELFPGVIDRAFDWPEDRSIVDAFPKDMGIKDIVELLSSVGFNSPPSWLRPFSVLSNGEQFRVTMARVLAERDEIAVVDEFTSVVDRTVAQIGSAAIARTIRKRNQKFIAVGCHYDVIDWLQPDWIYQPHLNEFTWRSLQRRPEIELTISRVDRKIWQLFKKHHYLDTSLATSAKCWAAFWGDRPVAFASAMPFPHPKRKRIWREHRTVCLPDFQGVGIGNALSEYVASIFRGAGYSYISRTGHPGMIAYRAKSRRWKMIAKPGRGKLSKTGLIKWQGASDRLTAAFEYVGPPLERDIAVKFLV